MLHLVLSWFTAACHCPKVNCDPCGHPPAAAHQAVLAGISKVDRQHPAATHAVLSPLTQLFTHLIHKQKSHTVPTPKTGAAWPSVSCRRRRSSRSRSPRSHRDKGRAGDKRSRSRSRERSSRRDRQRRRSSRQDRSRSRSREKRRRSSRSRSRSRSSKERSRSRSGDRKRKSRGKGRDKDKRRSSGGGESSPTAGEVVDGGCLVQLTWSCTRHNKSDSTAVTGSCLLWEHVARGC